MFNNLAKFKICLLFEPERPLLAIFSVEILTETFKDICIQCVVAFLFIILLIQNQPKCPRECSN